MDGYVDKLCKVEIWQANYDALGSIELEKAKTEVRKIKKKRQGCMHAFLYINYTQWKNVDLKNLQSIIAKTEETR